jgi:hypothetical protein
MPNPVPVERDSHVAAFSQTIDDCLELYRSSADAWNQSLSANVPAETTAATVRLMEDLSRGLLIKIFLTIVRADRRFSVQERELAQLLVARLWGRRFPADEIGTVLQGLVPMADKFDWYRLLRPFEEVPALNERVGEVETIVMRFGNLVAKADGTLAPEEAIQLKGLLAEIHRHLRPVPIENTDTTPNLPVAVPCDPRQLDALPAIKSVAGDAIEPSPDKASATQSKEDRLQAAFKLLDALIGLDCIKTEVRELIRFLQVQQHREQAGLPRTQVSLHTVFTGNPGTGKTSVARILGEVFGALGIVSRGHLVEADRSALVAGYMGQTAERTNRVVDKALDGVLFIDEAYSLINEEGDDPFGHEAVQILLKRMEDDRDRLVVVLAGYPAEMQSLLASNPGLGSRFHRTFEFADYTSVELCRIFHSLCEKNHYELPAGTRSRLLSGFEYLLARRDEHFGNGRLVRNVFEGAIRRLANRVADIVPLTKDLLTRLEPGDIVLPGVPENVLEAAALQRLQINVTCSGCGQVSRMSAAHLGRRVQCKKCQVRFNAHWGQPIVD